MTFWERLNNLMEINHLSQRAMEEIIGIRQPSISRWQSGILPKADIVLKIAKYFNVSVEYLIDGSGDGKENEVFLPIGIEEKTEIIRFKVSPRLKERINAARLAGAFNDEAESTFIGYLVKLGIDRYEKTMLPAERGENEDLETTLKKKKVS